MNIRFFLSVLVLLGSLNYSIVFAQNSNNNIKAVKGLETFAAAYKYLDMMYVDTLDAEQVINTGIRAMVGSLDPYTIYYTQKEKKDLETMLTGKYAGIGSIIRYNLAIKNVVIDDPFEGMPAAKAGLKKGDILISINDSLLTGKSASYVSNLLCGEPNTTFTLKIKRPTTGKIMKLKIKRSIIKMPTIPYYGIQNNGIGYLLFNSFTDNASEDVRYAVLDMKQKGMKALVLDLRNNPGGQLSEAVNIVNMFVPKGITIVKTRGKLKNNNNDYKTTSAPIDTVMPIAILVDDGTASSSEITCGALQDLDRAVIIGTRTYGKGLVQTPVDLPNNGSLKITTSKYYIPSGRCVQAINYKSSNIGKYQEHNVPDSLTKEFFTAHGRIVKDGGGIKPDIEIKNDTMNNLLVYLTGSGIDSTEVLLNWEINYMKKHKTIAPINNFKVTDNDFYDFKNTVLKSGFKYDRESEKVLNTLIKVAKFEGYYDDSKNEFNALKQKLKHNLSKELDRNKEDIKKFLELELINIYYYQRGAFQKALEYDKPWKEAVKILTNIEEYKKVLTPNNKLKS